MVSMYSDSLLGQNLKHYLLYIFIILFKLNKNGTNNKL